MSFTTYDKTPAADLDYGYNWSSWLATVGDTIASSTWTVPAGLTKHSEARTTTHTLVWLSGGTLNTQYEVKNTITTAGGRIESRILLIRIVER